MAGPRWTSEDRSMFLDAFIPLGQVPATANRLERAAGELRERAGSPGAVPSLPDTLAHLERAFDDLAVSMRQMAEAVAEWGGADDARCDEATLPPEARALLWHLRALAETLDKSRDGCTATVDWARRMLDEAATDTQPGVIMHLPLEHHSSDRPGDEPARARRIVCGVDGSEQARHAASAALRLADRLGARLMLVHVTP